MSGFVKQWVYPKLLLKIRLKKVHCVVILVLRFISKLRYPSTANDFTKAVLVRTLRVPINPTDLAHIATK